MAQFGYSIQTAQVTTGNFRTTIDPYNATLTSPYNLHGALNPLGASYVDNAPSLANPNGVATKYRYVRYLSTANPTATGVTGPFPVYWTDATYTTVTPVSSEGLLNSPNNIAGLAMPNLTALPQFTAAQLSAALNGNFIWIAVGGYVSGVNSLAGQAVGDALIGITTTTFFPGKVTANTAPTNRVIGFATTAVGTPAAVQCNVLVTLES